MSSANIPGVAPKVVGVRFVHAFSSLQIFILHVLSTRDQRLTATVVYILLGVSVLMAPVLKKVPFAVLFVGRLVRQKAPMLALTVFERFLAKVRPGQRG